MQPHHVLSSLVASVLVVFADLAIAEVFRRIAIILRLNVQNFDRRWNSVLPIQIAHIAESKALFCVI